jgi:hypothetical protein
MDRGHVILGLVFGVWFGLVWLAFRVLTPRGVSLREWLTAKIWFQ